MGLFVFFNLCNSSWLASDECRYYLVNGNADLAILIRADMAAEPAERLYRIVRELQAVEDNEFWEMEVGQQRD